MMVLNQSVLFCSVGMSTPGELSVTPVNETDMSLTAVQEDDVLYPASDR
jgi:hypothetical protein